MNKSDELNKVALGHMVITTRKRKMKNLNKKIKLATKIFDRTADVKEFLKNVTFNENLESYFKQRIDNTDSDDDDDEIIPNNFNIKCDFRKKYSRETKKRKSTADVDDESKKKKQKR